MTESWMSKVPRSDTEPEFKVRRILERLNQSFRSREPVGRFIVDFLVKGVRVIEVKGRFWHLKPRRIDSDELKRRILEDWGYPVLELWDDEVYKDPEGTERKIRDFLGVN